MNWNQITFEFRVNTSTFLLFKVNKLPENKLSVGEYVILIETLKYIKQ